MIKIFSFKRLTRFLGTRTGPFPWTPVLNDRQERLALQVGRTVRMTAAYMPWRADCFPQALCAKMLLRLYDIPYVAYFGLMRDEELGTMKAHAWVVSGRVAVTGGSIFAEYTIVGMYTCKELAKTIKLWRGA